MLAAKAESIDYSEIKRSNDERWTEKGRMPRGHTRPASWRSGSSLFNFFFLCAVEYLHGFCHGPIFMDDMTKRPDCWYRMRALPDVSSEVHTDGAPLHPVVDKLEYLPFCVHLRPSGDHDRDRTAVHDLIKVFAPVGLDDLGADLSGDPAAEAEVTGVPFLEFPSNRGDGHDRDAVSFCLIDKIPKIRQGLVLIVAADEYRHPHCRGIQPDGLFDRCGDALIGKLLPHHAGPAGYPQDNRNGLCRRYTGAQYPPGHKQGIAVGKK